MEKQGAIGVFDSGYGGLTVLKELRKRLPHYDFIYFGDNARAPYGNRSFDVVYEFTLEAVNFLFDQGCPLIILACNTASAKALRTIQQKDLPLMAPNRRVLGVIRPSTEVLGERTKTGHVGVLGTTGTVASNSFAIELAKFSPETAVHQHACPIWVPLIENQLHMHPAGQQFIQEDIALLLAQSPKIDTILLACTHYPVLQTQIEAIVGPSVRVIPQGPIVAEKLAQYLTVHTEMEERLSKNAEVRFFTSETPEVFNARARHFLDGDISAEHHSF
ncbi:MAG: glutamate racemase [Flavobacteriales bacterium]